MAFTPPGKKASQNSNSFNDYPNDYSGDYADDSNYYDENPAPRAEQPENPAPRRAFGSNNAQQPRSQENQQPVNTADNSGNAGNAGNGGYVRNRRFGSGVAPQPANPTPNNNQQPQRAFGARPARTMSNNGNNNFPSAQPSQFANNENQNRANSSNSQTPRFSQQEHPDLTRQAQERSSNALANFIPAGAAYSKSEPSAAYQEKVNAGNVHMRFSYWGNARTNNPARYPLSIDQPQPKAAPTPVAQENSYIPARKRSGFAEPFPTPENNTPSNTPSNTRAPAPAKSNVFTTNRSNPEDKSSAKSNNTILSENEQLEQAFSGAISSSKKSDSDNNIVSNERYLIINEKGSSVPQVELKETYDSLIVKIDERQAQIDAEVARLLAEKANAEPVKKAKKPTKKELAEQEAQANSDNSTETVAQDVNPEEETIKKVTPRKRAPNVNFTPKTIVDGSQFQEKNNLNYEGVHVSDLEKSGVSTSELLNLANIQISEKARFDVQQLSNIPVEILLEVLGAVKQDDGMLVGQHLIQQQEKTFKWFNSTTNKGSTGSINLMKHLIAVESNVLEHDNDKVLFKAACQKLTNLMPELLATYDKHNAENIAKQEADRKEQYYKLIQAIDALPLIDIMNFFQGKNNHKGISGRWKVNTNGHVYSINSSGWYSFTESVGGRGAIGFAAHAIALENNLNYADKNDHKKLRRLAIGMLKEEFKNDIDLNANYDDVAFYSGDFKVPFSMPLLLQNKQTQVRNYLHEKRGLPNWIINKQMAAGLLFPGFPSDWKNPPTATNIDAWPDKNVWAVFLAKSGNAAEMRGIDRYDGSAKLLAKGSEKENGGHLVKAELEHSEGMLCSFEASIDACSYAAIYPGRVTSSCMGVNYNLAASMAIETLENGYKYGLCFDNDLVGNVNHYRFKEEMIARLGKDEYEEYYNSNKIEYFQLGKLTLKEQVYSGQRYYFDVNYDMDGKNTFALFHAELVKDLGLDEVKKLYSTGKVFAYNVTPDFSLIREKDIESIAIKTADLILNENKPLYFVTEAPKLDSSEADIQEKIDEHKVKLEKHHLFMTHFKQVLGSNYVELQRNGAIVKNTNSFAKDWNEYLNKMRDLHPEFAKQQQEYEDKFSTIYTKDIQLELVAGKIKKRP